MNFLREESKKRDDQHAEIVGSVNGLKSTVGDLQKSIDLKKSTREKEIADVKCQIAELQKQDEKVVEKVLKDGLEKMNLGNFSPPGINLDECELRKRQVMVSGLGEAGDVTKKLEHLVKKIVGANQGLTINTAGRDSKLAMITFPTVPAKIDFYKKAKDHADVPTDVHFFNNRSFEERIADKKLGLLKHLMVESKKFQDGQVKIIWNQRVVALGNKRVAWFEGEQFVASKSAKEFLTEMEKLLKEWIDKRSTHLETDSE